MDWMPIFVSTLVLCRYGISVVLSQVIIVVLPLGRDLWSSFWGAQKVNLDFIPELVSLSSTLSQ